MLRSSGWGKSLECSGSVAIPTVGDGGLEGEHPGGLALKMCGHNRKSFPNH